MTGRIHGAGKEAGHFGEVLGYRLAESGKDFVVLEFRARREHRNLYGSVHGGVILALLDTAGLWSGAYQEDGTLVPASTAGISCNFLRAAKSDLIRVRGEVTKRGRSLYFTSCWARTHPDGVLLATGQGVYSFVKGASPGAKAQAET